MKALSSSKGLFLQSLTRTLSPKRIRGPHFLVESATAAEIWTAIVHTKVFQRTYLRKK